MPQRVNAEVNPVKPPRANPRVDPVLVEANLAHLPNGHDAMLPSRDSRQTPVEMGARVAHRTTKAPSVETLPPKYAAG